MKNKMYLTLGFLILCLTHTLWAQSPSPPLPPPPAIDYSPKGWMEYSYDEGRFTISCPGKPKETSMVNDKTAFGQVKIFALTYSGLLIYQAGYTEYAKDYESDAKKGKFLDTIQASALQAVSILEPKLKTQKDVEVDGHPGRYIELTTRNNRIIRNKWVVVGNRLYFSSVNAPLDHKNALMSENGYEEIALAFIDSLKIKK